METTIRMAYVVVAATFLAACALTADFNYDDTYLIGAFFPDSSAAKSVWWNLYTYFFDTKYITSVNEFRTYGLSKVLHFGLFHLFGTNPAPYAMVTASIWIAAAWFVSRSMCAVTGSEETALCAFYLWLISPFSYFPAFHHASYLALPTAFLAGYIYLALTNRGRWLRLACAVLTVITGEAAIIVLLAVIAMGATRDRRSYLVDGAVVLGLLLALYAFYRIFVYDPVLVSRFPFDVGLFLKGIVPGVFAFGSSMLAYFAPVQPMGAVNWGIVSLAVAAAIACHGTFRTAVPMQDGRLVAGLAIIAAASTATYFVVGTQMHLTTYPYRYVQVTGAWSMLFALAVTGSAAVRVTLAIISTVPFVVTFGVTLPGLQVSSRATTDAILAAKTPASKAILIVRGKPTDFVIADRPPATTPLSEWWTMIQYGRMKWGVNLVGSAWSREGEGIRISNQYQNDVFSPAEIQVLDATAPGLCVYSTFADYENRRGRCGILP
jgi:hypothetical protein